MRVVASLFVLVILLSGSTSARAEAPVLSTTSAPTPVAVSPWGTHWRLWPIGGAVVGGLTGIVVGAGVATGTAYALDARNPCGDCEEGGPAFAALLLGVPLGFLGGVAGAITGIVVGASIAFPEEQADNSDGT